jgi:hypothetical protein
LDLAVRIFRILRILGDGLDHVEYVGDHVVYWQSYVVYGPE